MLTSRCHRTTAGLPRRVETGYRASRGSARARVRNAHARAVRRGLEVVRSAVRPRGMHAVHVNITWSKHGDPSVRRHQATAADHPPSSARAIYSETQHDSTKQFRKCRTTQDCSTGRPMLPCPNVRGLAADLASSGKGRDAEQDMACSVNDRNVSPAFDSVWPRLAVLPTSTVGVRCLLRLRTRRMLIRNTRTTHSHSRDIAAARRRICSQNKLGLPGPARASRSVHVLPTAWPGLDSLQDDPFQPLLFWICQPMPSLFDMAPWQLSSGSSCVLRILCRPLPGKASRTKGPR